jgi:CHAD domain-containing protein
VLRTRREVYLVGRDGADVVQLHLVSALVPARGTEPPLQVARVELYDVQEGHAETLSAFMDAMRQGCRLRPSGGSTYESVLFALGDGPAPLPYVGGTEVTGAMTVAEVAYAVLRRHFLRWLRHDPGTRVGEDIEELHDMRVSTRRMRAAIKLFRPFLPVRVLSLNSELRWLAAALGEVRDLDVQLEQLEEWEGSVDESDRAALHVLAAGIEKRRVAARKRLLRALDSRRYERLVDRVVRVLRQGPGKQPIEGRQPVLGIAPQLIGLKHRKIVKRGKRIDDSSPDAELHSLRIQCKGLRYALEFHSELYGEPAQRLIRVLVRLQDVLGEHQDACVAADHLREIVDQGGRRVPPPTVFVVGRLAERYAVRAQELRSAYAKAFKPLRGKRWDRLKRKMAALGAAYGAKRSMTQPPSEAT